MLHIDDHPEWVTKFELGLKDTPLEYCIVEDDELWGVLKEHDEVPHVANVWMNELFGRIKDYMSDFHADKIEVNYYVNAMCSSIELNGKEITTARELLDMIEKENQE